MKVSFNKIIIIFLLNLLLSCISTFYSINKDDIFSEMKAIERLDHIIYFYEDSKVYIKKDKKTNNFSLFFTIFLKDDERKMEKYIKIVNKRGEIDTINVSKNEIIRNTRYLTFILNKNEIDLILKALISSNEIYFKSDNNNFQAWTNKYTKVFDERYIDINFKNTYKTIKYYKDYILKENGKL